MRVAFVLGTRPEIVKLSPLIQSLRGRARAIVIHSGQHYSHALDGIFFEELALTRPDYELHVGSGLHGEQVGAMLPAIERVLVDERPGAVVVQGDTNTTLAGALAAAKAGFPVAHLEAGCRSGNRRMPEEVNRVLVADCADLHLAPNEEAKANLLREGIGDDAIRVVGSTSIDSCRLHSSRAADRRPAMLAALHLDGDYAVATIHRAENTQEDVLTGILDALSELSRKLPVVFPMHPRTKAAGGRPRSDAPDLRVVEPLGYLDALALYGGAQVIVSDSGGIQEEGPALGVPVVVARNETEWGEMLGETGNALAGNNPAGILRAVDEVLRRPRPRINLPILARNVGAAERAAVSILELARGFRT